MRDHKLIGYSLSLCVSDIVIKNIPLERIEKIIAGTAAQSEEDWEKLLDIYGQSYWHRYQNQARSIVWALRDSNRIEQPRVTDPDYRHSIYTSIWDREP